MHGGWEGYKPVESVDLFVPKTKKEGANVKVFSDLSSLYKQTIDGRYRFDYSNMDNG